MFRTDSSIGMTEPFVGAIVGPYDQKLPDSYSLFNWFYVGNKDQDLNRPKKLDYTLETDRILDLEVQKMVFKLDSRSI